MMKKVFMAIVSFLLLWVGIGFQINFLNSIPLMGVTANLGIVLVAGLGLVSGKLIGGVIGGIYGFFIDLTLGRCVGLYTLLYCLTGLIAGYLNHNFAKENKLSMVMLILFATIVFESLVYFFAVLFRHFDFSFQSWFETIVLETLYNIFLTFLLFRPIAFWGDILNHCKNSYYLL